MSPKFLGLLIFLSGSCSHVGQFFVLPSADLDYQKVTNLAMERIKDVRVLAKKDLNPEISSMAHQWDVLQAPKPLLGQLEALQFDYAAFKRGVIDSDMGKQKRYQKLFLKSSRDSDLLLDFLTLRGNKELVDPLKELLVQIGMGGKSLLNPHFSNDQLRAVFHSTPILLGYLHALPGMIDALIAYRSVLKEGDGQHKNELKQAFQKQLATNLFHNGPEKGFWELFGHIMIPSEMVKTVRSSSPVTVNFKTFFKGTVYEGPINSLDVILPRYPGPISFEGALHCFYDRMSQATMGGVDKIFKELYTTGKGNPITHLYQLLFTNPKWTITQLQALKSYATEDGQRLHSLLSSGQKQVLDTLTSKGIKRIEQYLSFVRDHFLLMNAKEGSMGILATGLDIIIDSQTKIELRTEQDGHSLTTITGKQSQRQYFALKMSDQFALKVINGAISVLEREQKANRPPLQFTLE